MDLFEELSEIFSEDNNQTMIRELLNRVSDLISCVLYIFHILQSSLKHLINLKVFFNVYASANDANVVFQCIFNFVQKEFW